MVTDGVFRVPAGKDDFRVGARGLDLIRHIFDKGFTRTEGRELLSL